jgi:hypothetical protein
MLYIQLNRARIVMLFDFNGVFALFGYFNGAYIYSLPVAGGMFVTRLYSDRNRVI